MEDKKTICLTMTQDMVDNIDDYVDKMRIEHRTYNRSAFARDAITMLLSFNMDSTTLSLVLSKCIRGEININIIDEVKQ